MRAAYHRINFFVPGRVCCLLIVLLWMIPFFSPAQTKKRRAITVSAPKPALSKAASKPAGPPKIKIVIDAGHGGRDPGKERSKAIYQHEKHLALAIALKFGAYVEEYLDNVDIIYTRKRDVYVPLEKRVEIANSSAADYFFSIHCNANKNSKIYGSQMHIHSHAFYKSKQLAYEIDREFQASGRRFSRGILNARDRDYNLYVLQYTKMPGLLIETGFLTNPREERFLNTEAGQDIIAFAIFKGFVNYLRKMKVPFKEKKKLEDKEFILASRDMEPDEEEQQASKKPVYSVQIRASDKKIPLTDASFKKLKMEVFELVSDNREEIFRYRYMVGKLPDLKSANELMKLLRKMGFKDAFIVPPGYY